MKAWTLMIQRNSMIPRYSIGSMDFENPKVCGDTSFFDGLVFQTVFPVIIFPVWFILVFWLLISSTLWCVQHKICASFVKLHVCIGSCRLTLVAMVDHGPADWLVTPTCPPSLSNCDCVSPNSPTVVVSCVESHWLHLSGFSPLWVIADNQLLRFQCSDCLHALAQGWLWGQKLHASCTQQWASWCQF